MKIPLEPDAVALLREVLQKHAPQFLGALAGESIELPDLGAANEVRSVIGDELTSTGFDESWEPNARGLRLEALIDGIGRPVM